MAILNMTSVVNSVQSLTPFSNESSSSSLSPDHQYHPRQTKIILPKKKPQKWSTGVSPGDYGGPPTTTKLRKYWGGEGEDPLTSNEYIWNKDFMGRMKRFVQDPDVSSSSSSSAQSTRVKEAPSGFLSLNRVMSLDSLEIDLSKKLKVPLKAAAVEQNVEAEPQKIGIASPKWKLAPTLRGQNEWDRASKATTAGTDVMLREVRLPRGDPEVLAAQSMEQYYKLKNKLQVLTVSIGGFGLVSSYITYSPEIAASFGVGFLGSLMYIRMLGSTVDSMADGARGLIKGAIGQPRLLVPVVLVMVYNRWNGILVPDYGVMNLQLIPMLVGFFTYKIASFLQAIEEAISIVENKTET